MHVTPFRLCLIEKYNVHVYIYIYDIIYKCVLALPRDREAMDLNTKRKGHNTAICAATARHHIPGDSVKT